MKIKEKVIGIIGRMNFSEYLEEEGKCPKCEKDTLIRHIEGDIKNNWLGRWFIEYCTDETCPYWNCNFLSKFYKPSEEYKKYSDNPMPIVREKKNEQ